PDASRQRNLDVTAYKKARTGSGNFETIMNGLDHWNFLLDRVLSKQWDLTEWSDSAAGVVIDSLLMKIHASNVSKDWTTVIQNFNHAVIALNLFMTGNVFLEKADLEKLYPKLHLNGTRNRLQLFNIITPLVTSLCLSPLALFTKCLLMSNYLTQFKYQEVALALGNTGRPELLQQMEHATWLTLVFVARGASTEIRVRGLLKWWMESLSATVAADKHARSWFKDPSVTGDANIVEHKEEEEDELVEDADTNATESQEEYEQIMGTLHSNNKAAEFLNLSKTPATPAPGAAAAPAQSEAGPSTRAKRSVTTKSTTSTAPSRKSMSKKSKKKKAAATKKGKKKDTEADPAQEPPQQSEEDEPSYPLSRAGVILRDPGLNKILANFKSHGIATVPPIVEHVPVLDKKATMLSETVVNLPAFDPVKNGMFVVPVTPIVMMGNDNTHLDFLEKLKKALTKTACQFPNNPASNITVVTAKDFADYDDPEALNCFDKNIVVIRADQPMIHWNWDLLSMSHLGNVQQNIQVQDMAYRDPNNFEVQLRIASREQLVKAGQRPDELAEDEHWYARKVLNGLDNAIPQPLADMPNYWTLATHEQVMNCTDAILGVNMARRTVCDFSWASAATRHSVSDVHLDTDGLGTTSRPLVGRKLWVLLTPHDDRTPYIDLITAQNLSALDLDNFMVEGIILGPGCTLYQCPNQLHWVYGMDPTIVYSRHFYSMKNLAQSLYGQVHTQFAGTFLTNASHPTLRPILADFMTLWQTIAANTLFLDLRKSTILIPSVDKLTEMQCPADVPVLQRPDELENFIAISNAVVFSITLACVEDLEPDPNDLDAWSWHAQNMVTYLDLMDFYISSGYSWVGVDSYEKEPYAFFAYCNMHFAQAVLTYSFLLDKEQMSGGRLKTQRLYQLLHCDLGRMWGHQSTIVKQFDDWSEDPHKHLQEKLYPSPAPAWTAIKCKEGTQPCKPDIPVASLLSTSKHRRRSPSTSSSDDLPCKHHHTSGAAEREGSSPDDENDYDYDSDDLSSDEEEEEEEEDNYPTKKQKQQHPQFLSEHPHHNTHTIRIHLQGKAKVPCFIGVLPRPDKGNYEDYCMTMLTLFKPWRTGHNLKSETKSWEDSFNSHVFTERQKEIMQFMNIRHECYDARDDFRAQRIKAGAAKGLTYIGGRFVDELDKENMLEEEIYRAGLNYLDTAFDDTNISATNLERAIQMAQIEAVVQAAGWLGKNKAAGNENMTQEAEWTNGQQKDAAGWKNLLAAKRAEVLADKLHIPAGGDGPPKSDNPTFDIPPNDAMPIYKDYLTQDFAAERKEEQNLIDSFVLKFTLNEEQERAFRIIANHSVSKVKDQLQMYIGGMGGTGKSQVIKALTAFFEARGKKFAFLIMAPIGTAAALISGSTYHSVLGFRGGSVEDRGDSGVNESQKTLDAIRERIRNAEYIFLDEISMVDCGALHSMSSQMNLALRIDDAAFAGKNMIYAGDFGQLPPVSASGPALYSNKVRSIVHTTNAVRLQKQSIGKALWHQATVVVLLKQNMRQKTQSQEDAKFRTLLENCRMASCTAEDIQLMLSCIPNDDNPHIDISKPEFRHSSIITAWNVQRDRLNELGSEQFAEDTRQKLQTFYAVDTLSSRQANQMTGQTTDPLRRSNYVPEDKAEKLLQIRSGATGHIPGILKLCYGLPVLIKKNEAVELNVTNGAEGIVTGFKSYPISQSKEGLDVVFVTLKDPPTPIQLEGLRLNEVPVSKQSISVKVEMPNGTKIRVNRQQVPILPNFAMTDYGCQGRTRPINIVDLRHCKNHQSVYTCLSRASTLNGTVILRMCDISMITKGMSGYLRQEFRELEVLNYITKLRFEGKLKPGVGGNTRCSLIKSFQKVYKNYCPKDTPDPLKWNETDPILRAEEDNDDFIWRKAESNNTSQNKGVKQKRDKQSDSTKALNLKNDIIPDIEPPKKKQRREVNLNDSLAYHPLKHLSQKLKEME
ncbi:hypothetical protein EVG20_g8875, partial [Dentipellis fragilis]